MLSVAALGSAAMVTAATARAGATGAGVFATLAPGYTQQLYATQTSMTGGLAFADTGDLVGDSCAWFGGDLFRVDSTSTVVVDGTSVHPVSDMTSRAGCGLAAGTGGSVYSNVLGGADHLDATTGAVLHRPAGGLGNGNGVAVDPVTGNVVFVGLDDSLHQVDSTLTTASTFSWSTANLLVDGLTFTPGGDHLLAAVQSYPYAIDVLDRSGAVVATDPLAVPPSGIAVHTHPDYLAVNTLVGSVLRLDFPGGDVTGAPTVSTLAGGGVGGEGMAVAADGCLYAGQNGTVFPNGDTTSDSSVVRLCAPLDPAITLTASDATGARSLIATTATFTDPDPQGTASDYTAVIDWGDGSGPAAGGIVQLSAGTGGSAFAVGGAHRYATSGTYAVTTTVTDGDPGSPSVSKVVTGAVTVQPGAATTCAGVAVGATVAGRVTVPPGQSCTLVGTTVQGDVHSHGGTLNLDGTSVHGNVLADSGGSVALTGATVSGNVQLIGTRASNAVCRSTIGGNLAVHEATGTTVVGDPQACSAGNTIGGDVDLHDNSGPPPVASVLISDNRVAGDLQCQHDQPAADGTGGSNQVGGAAHGECVPLAS